MRYEFDSMLLAEKLLIKRVIKLKTGLREVAKESKVSSATLCRAEKCNPIDIETLIKISNWLGESPRSFFIPIKSKKKA